MVEMNGNMNEYNDLINLMTSMPKVAAPEGFTQNVMARLPASPHVFEHLWRQAVREAGELSWPRFYDQCIQKREPSLNFLLSGFFHFLMGAIILSGLFMMGRLHLLSMDYWLLAVLILVASLILGSAGLIIAFDLPYAGLWAERLIILYIALMFINASLIHFSLHISSIDFFALSFAATSLMMGMILWRSLKPQTSSVLSLQREG